MDQHTLGQVVPGPVAIVLDESNVVLPDVVYAATASFEHIREGRYYGAPDLIVEVISPSIPGYDTVTKLFLYAKSGVPEYWLADPATRIVQVLALVDGI